MTTWRDQAACRDVDTDLFFPVQQTSEREWELARAICRHCPVKAECLDAALSFEGADRQGMWAGMTPDERARLVKRRRRARR